MILHKKRVISYIDLNNRISTVHEYSGQMNALHIYFDTLIMT